MLIYMYIIIHKTLYIMYISIYMYMYIIIHKTLYTMYISIYMYMYIIIHKTLYIMYISIYMYIHNFHFVLKLLTYSNDILKHDVTLVPNALSKEKDNE